MWYFFKLQQCTNFLSRLYKRHMKETHRRGLLPKPSTWIQLLSGSRCHLRCSVIWALPPTTPEAANISLSLVAYLLSAREFLGRLRASQMTLDFYLSNWGPPFRTAWVFWSRGQNSTIILQPHLTVQALYSQPQSHDSLLAVDEAADRGQIIMPLHQGFRLILFILDQEHNLEKIKYIINYQWHGNGYRSLNPNPELVFTASCLLGCQSEWIFLPPPCLVHMCVNYTVYRTTNLRGRKGLDMFNFWKIQL